MTSFDRKPILYRISFEGRGFFQTRANGVVVVDVVVVVVVCLIRNTLTRYVNAAYFYSCGIVYFG
jgi:hypothetical protein